MDITKLILGAALWSTGMAGLVSAQTALDTNLIANGDAEASTGASNYNVSAPPVGWSTTSNFSVVRYDAPNPGASSPIKPAASAQFGGGKNLFAGGPDNADATAFQTIDVKDRAAEIDSGTLTASLSGYFGGISGQDDLMTLNAEFRNAQGEAYATTSIGNVTQQDRYGADQVYRDLVYRSRTLAVPVGTRSIVVTLHATRANKTNDTYNDGYADNLRLELVKTGGVNTFAQSYGKTDPVLSNPGRGFDYPNGIAPMPDGGVVVTGVLGRTAQSGEALYNYDVLICYGADGKILWQKEFPDSGGSGASGLVTTDAQGGVYFASGFHNNYNNSLFPFVAKFDLNGVQQWFTNIQVPGSDVPNGYYEPNSYLNTAFTGIYLSPAGELVLGTGLSVEGQVIIPGIVRVNAATGSASCIGLNSTSGNGGNAFVVPSLTVPGRYAVATTNSADRTGPELVLIDSSGKTIAARGPISVSTYYGGGMIPTADGGYLVLASSGGGYFLVSKFGPDLSLQFQKQSNEFGDFSAPSVVQTADGGYLVCSRVNFSGAPSKVAFIKLTAQGNLESAYALGGARTEGYIQGGAYPSAAVFTTDGGMALATSTTSYTGDTSDAPDWWVVKADKLGRVANFQDVMVDIGSKIFMRDYTYPYPPQDKVGFDDPKPYALNNPAKDPRPGFVVPQSLISTDPDGTTRVQAQAAFPAPLPPPHGGVGGTTFTVNGNQTAVTQNLADTVLHFAAGQTSHAAGLFVKVQSASDPNGTWTDLPAGRGLMIFDATSNQYILNTTNYPTQSPTYFRAVSFAGAYTTSVSNVVGPFNLASNLPHLGPTLLFGSRNGLVANLRFGVTEMNIPSGVPVGVRIQTSSTPANDSSWADIANGSLTLDPAAPDQFYGGLDDYPPGEGIYFRAIASASGYVSSVSQAIGPVTVVLDPAATFKPFVITPLGGTVGGGDGSTIDAPVVVSSRSFKVTATVNSPVGGHQIKGLFLQYDGDVIESFNGASESGNTVLYTTNIPGDHLIEAVATDDLGVIGDASPLHLRVAPLAPGLIYTLVQSGDWSNAANWRNSKGNNGVPGPNDFAVLSTKSVSLSQNVTVNAASLNGGAISGPGALTITGFFTVASGQVKNDLTISAGATYELINDTDVGMGGHVTNNGILKMHGRAGITGIRSGTPAKAEQMGVGSELNGFNFFDGLVAVFKNIGKFVFHRPAGGRSGSSHTPPPLRSNPVLLDTRPLVVGIVAQGGGNIIAQGGGNIIAQGGGNIIAQGGGNIIAQGGGNIIAQGGGNIIAQGGGNIVAAGGGNIIAQGGGNIIAAGGGNLVGNSGGTFQIKNGAGARSATVEAATAAASGFIQSGGEVDLSQITIIGPVDLEGGVLTGSGVIYGDLTNNGGYISPGHSAGLIEVSGNFTQSTNGTLVVENGGPYPDQFDQLQVGGSASLGGAIHIHSINGYTPDPADTFNPLGYGSVNGAFASVTSNASVTLNATGVLVTLDPTKPNPVTGQPINISTRLRVLTDDNVLIGGFIVSGASGSSKKVLVRGIGPNLSNYGVPGALSDPLLELHKPDGSTVTNDNWQEATNAGEIPSDFQPKSPKESAILINLTPGAYSVILKGAHGEIGVGLTEVYDLDATGPAQLVNISTRGFVDINDNVMIGGFIVGGSEPAQILIRATGPSLKNYGLTGVLEDPVLELHDTNGAVITNDDWRETQEGDIIATKIQPTDNQEPAILATLVPGAYSAIVRGKNGTTGTALVEAYKVK